MTHNQIAYQANLINEAKNLEQARSNQAREAIDKYLAELQNTKLQVESSLEQLRIKETSRHNLAQERLQGFANQLAQNQLLLDSAKASEVARHNLANESEQSRHNVETERLTSIKQDRDWKLDQYKAGLETVKTAGNLFSAVTKAFNPFQLIQ